MWVGGRSIAWDAVKPRRRDQVVERLENLESVAIVVCLVWRLQADRDSTDHISMLARIGRLPGRTPSPNLGFFPPETFDPPNDCCERIGIHRPYI